MKGRNLGFFRCRVVCYDMREGNGMKWKKSSLFFGMRAGVGWPALFHLLFTFLFARVDDALLVVVLLRWCRTQPI